MGANGNSISDEELLKVSGGAVRSARASSSSNKKSEFENAWRTLGMDEKGYSGLKRAELYDEWEMKGFCPEATAFLAGK